MTCEICKLNIDSKPFSFQVEGDFSWGESVNTFILENNIISKTNWIKDGYTIVNDFFESQNEFKLFQNEVKKNIIKAIKLNDIEFEVLPPPEPPDPSESLSLLSLSSLMLS